jgi:hypothetical protein
MINIPKCTNSNITGVLFIPKKKGINADDLNSLLKGNRIRKTTKRGANIELYIQDNFIKSRYVKNKSI